jgi:SAM-dependent methyltransferase
VTRTFDAKETEEFFNNVYSAEDLKNVTENPEAWLHERDHMLLDEVLPAMGSKLSILDYGCGQGRLVAELLARGHDAWGMEKHDGMYEVARQTIADAGGKPEQMVLAGLESLRDLPAESLDVFIAMGVFQYVEAGELDETMAAARRLLKPGGRICCTFQNAFFDLFTFNRYTIDFIVNDLLAPYVSDDEKSRLEEGLGTLMTEHDMPPYGQWRARDNVFVRLSNPLTIGDELKAWGFDLAQIWFYEFFGTPPLLNSVMPEATARIREHFSIQNATRWEGHFLANAFLVSASRI